VPNLNSSERQQLANGPPRTPRPISYISKGATSGISAATTWTSIDYFKQAVALDPSFALAYVGLLTVTAWARGLQTEAESAVRAHLNSTTRWLKRTRRWVLSKCSSTGTGRAREAEMRRGIELNPNYATRISGTRPVSNWSAGSRKPIASCNLHCTRSAVVPNQRGHRELRFFSTTTMQPSSNAARPLEMDGRFRAARVTILETYLQEASDGAPSTILQIHADHRSRQKDHPYVKAYAAMAREVSCASSSARCWCERQTGCDGDGPARRYAQLGDKEQTFQWLQRGYEQHTFLLPFINPVPAYDKFAQTHASWTSSATSASHSNNPFTA